MKPNSFLSNNKPQLDDLREAVGDTDEERERLCEEIVGSLSFNDENKDLKELDRKYKNKEKLKSQRIKEKISKTMDNVFVDLDKI